jgi:serine/threonine protein kinase
LHSLPTPLVHRDLNTSNILVDSGCKVKITDFGLSKFRAPVAGAGNVNLAPGNLLYMAPEVLTDPPGEFTEASDVYSYGIVMWELLTLKVPWLNDGVHPLAVPSLVRDRGERPTVPDDLSEQGFEGIEAYTRLMRRCWAQDPAERPSMMQAVEEVRRLRMRTRTEGPARRVAPVNR